MAVSTLIDVFYTGIDRNLDRVMMFKQTIKWIPISSRELYRDVVGAAKSLARWGVQKGDRVAILSENRSEWAVADYATLLLGAGLVLSNLIASRPTLHLTMLTLFPLVLATIRGVQRTTGVSELMPAWRAQIMDLTWVWTMLALVVPFLYLLNFAASAFTRTLRWRGIRYRLISPNQTSILPG